MQKSNSFSKKLGKRLLSFNNTIESYFNKLQNLKSFLKKKKLAEYQRFFYIIGPIIILTLSYFLMPTIYDKKLVVADIKDQFLERYDINIKFNEKLNYSLLPKPHFYSKNVTILNLDRDIASARCFILKGRFLPVVTLTLSATLFSISFIYSLFSFISFS